MATKKLQYKVLEAVEELEVGQVIELTKKQAEKLGTAVELVPEEPKAKKGLRVVGLYDGQQIDRTYEDAELAQQFCDKINNSGRNGNNAKLV
jgi:hypothetical protein